MCFVLKQIMPASIYRDIHLMVFLKETRTTYIIKARAYFLSFIFLIIFKFEKHKRARESKCSQFQFTLAMSISLPTLVLVSSRRLNAVFSNSFKHCQRK